MARQMLRTAIRWLAALVLVVSVAGAGLAAQGGTSLSPEARQAMEKGLAAANSKDYRLAIRHFEEARKIAPYAPELLFNLGLAESRTPGRELAAMVWLKAYLAADPEAAGAQKVQNLCSQLDATAEGTIKKLIDLEIEMLGRLPESGWRHISFSWMVTYRLHLRDLAGARQTAELMGNAKGGGYYKIAQYQAENGDVEGALKTAEIASDKGYLYQSIAMDQARMGDVAGTLRTMELARRFGRDDFTTVMEALARRSDVDGAMKVAEAAGIKSPAFLISRAQAKKGDVKGAMQTAERGGFGKEPGVCTDIAEAQAKKGDLQGALQTAERGGLTRESEVYGYIAAAQATNGDIKTALQTAEKVRESERYARQVAYRGIAFAQALKGDLAGARKTAPLIPASYQAITDSHEKNGTEWIEIVIALLKTRNAGHLRERTNVLLNSRLLIDILNSSAFPWFNDLPAYLKSLNAMNQPADIEGGVRKALMGRVEKYMGEESEAKKGGMLTNLQKVRGLDKPDED
jgi:tetratricopeptide (TPR) repeat protein